MLHTRTHRRALLAGTATALVAATGLAAPPTASAARLAPSTPTLAATALPSATPAPPGGPGARVPFTEYVAADTRTTGTLVGPDRVFTHPAAEAVGRRAVHLAAGQDVEFTLATPANAVDLRYSIPDGPDSVLKVDIDGAHCLDLGLTAKYSHFYGNYPFTNNPRDSGEHHYFDDVRTLFGRVLPPGTRVRFQATSDTYIDVADFEHVRPAASMPAGFLDVTAFGADPGGATDSGAAIQAAIDAGKTQKRGVWIPPGTYQVNRHLVVDQVTVQGAGPWHSVLHGNGVGVFGQAAATPSTAVHLSGFAIFGETTVRDDSTSDSGVGGSLSGGSTVDDVWIQHTKTGMWFDGPSDGLIVTRARIQDTTADGVNLHDGVSHTVIRDTFVRNTGDDGMAMWSDQNADHDDVFDHDTVSQPQLANGFALYGGHDNAVTSSIAADTVTQGGGIHVGNRFGAVPVSGTTTIAGNLLVRDGNLVPNDPTEIGALWFDAADAPMTGTIDVHDDTLLASPYSGIQFVGKPITGVTVNRVAILGAGTFAVQLQSPGTASFTGVVATHVGVSGIYDCASGFTVVRAGADFGWDGSTCGFPPAGQLQIAQAAGVDFGFQPLGTATAQPVTITNPGPDPVTIERVADPAGFTADAGRCAVLAPGQTCTITVGFAPVSSGSYSGLLTIDSTSAAGPYVVGVHGIGFDPNGDLALGRSVTVSSQAGSWLGPANLVDGNPGTYWESQDGTFPQWATVDLGRPTSVDRIVLKLPPNWGARTESLSVSADGDPLKPSADYTLDPATGNSVTITFPATVLRTLTVTVTGNTGWPAAQFSELEVYAH